VPRTFPLLIRQLRVEVSQDLTDGEAERLRIDAEVEASDLAAKLEKSLRSKYPKAGVVVRSTT
jgi:hypothetical protein